MRNGLVNVLLIKECNLWVAQCLDFDINAQGTSIDNALEALDRTFTMYSILDDETRMEIDSAPLSYWNQYSTGHRVHTEKDWNVRVV